MIRHQIIPDLVVTNIPRDNEFVWYPSVAELASSNNINLKKHNRINSSEEIITAIANQLGIRTYTFQHGVFGPCCLPIISKTIFVWGESSKKYLISWGYSSERIVILGRLKFFDGMENEFPDKKEVRARFAEKYQFDPNKLIVGYFPSDWDEDLNYKLFLLFVFLA